MRNNIKKEMLEQICKLDFYERKNTVENLISIRKIIRILILRMEVQMDIVRALLDGVALAAIFNGAAAVLVLINPRYLMDSYPKDIQKAAPQSMTEKEKKINLIFMSVTVGICCFYAVLSAIHSDVQGFWALFWTGYINWTVVNFADLFLLDYILIQKFTKHIIIPGTEGHPTYEKTNWMKKFAFPEHFILWPLVQIPILSLIQTGLCMLIRWVLG